MDALGAYREYNRSNHSGVSPLKMGLDGTSHVVSMVSRAVGPQGMTFDFHRLLCEFLHRPSSRSVLARSLLKESLGLPGTETRRRVSVSRCRAVVGKLLATIGKL